MKNGDNVIGRWKNGVHVRGVLVDSTTGKVRPHNQPTEWTSKVCIVYPDSIEPDSPTVEYCTACYDGLRPGDGSTCSTCGGLGVIEIVHPGTQDWTEKCAACEGTGREAMPRISTGPSGEPELHDCIDCEGTGIESRDFGLPVPIQCAFCKGTGKLP